jgi:integrase
MSDILDNPGPLAHLSKDQRDRKQSAYGRWLGFAADGNSTNTGASGVDLLTPDRLRAYIDILKTLFAPYTVAGYLTDLDFVVRAFRTGRQFEFLRIAATNLRRQGRPARDKRPRLRPSVELYQLGLDLIRSADNQRTAFNAAETFRDGLMIALLAARPIRLKNLASIEIDRHLSLHGDDYWLTFPAREIKTRRHLEFPLPAELSIAMDRYLVSHRPILTARTGRWNRGAHSGLWVSAHGSKLHADRIYQRICDLTRERFGRSINPHLFRDAAATSIAIEDPSHVGIVTTILGHSNTETAQTYYNQASSLEAARSHQAVIQRFRSLKIGRG